jgi:hypothetical protein
LQTQFSSGGQGVESLHGCSLQVGGGVGSSQVFVAVLQTQSATARQSSLV